MEENKYTGISVIRVFMLTTHVGKISDSNSGPGENVSLKLLISTCQMVILKAKIIFKILPICVVNTKTLIKEMRV